MANSTNIEDHYVTQFDTNWRHLAQQMGSRAKQYAMVYSVSGKERTFNQQDKSAMRAITTRNGATIATPLVQRKRWLRPVPYDEVTHFDEWDDGFLGETVLPTSTTVQAHAYAWGRQCDQSIYDALIGTAAEGVTGGDSITLASYTPPDGSSGDHDIGNVGALDTPVVVDLGRLISESEGYNEDNPSDELCQIICAQQVEDMLNDTAFISSDYNSVKALVNGKMSTWGGFHWIRLSVDIVDRAAATDLRTCVAYVKSGIALGSQGQSVKFSIRDDINETLQIRTKGKVGAVRLEEAKVVAYDADESP